MSNTTEKLVIIGGGPAGLTAGIYAARANLSPIVIEGPKPGGQLTGTTFIENWPGTKSIIGGELMINIKYHAKNSGCKFISGSVTSVDFKSNPMKLKLENGNEIETRSVIIATGATPNKLKCKGEDIFWGKGVSSCAVCDGSLYQNQKVLVIGGGDSAMESALFLVKNQNSVTIIQIQDTLNASFVMQQPVLKNKNIKIIYNSSIEEISGDEKLSGAIIKNLKTGEKQYMPADGIFLAIGMTPNSSVFKDQLKLLPSGHISTSNSSKTTVDGVYAAGDVVDAKYRQAIVSAGFGCIAALEAEKYLNSLDM